MSASKERCLVLVVLFLHLLQFADGLLNNYSTKRKLAAAAAIDGKKKLPNVDKPGESYTLVDGASSWAQF